MRSRQHAITAAEVQRLAQQRLQTQVPLRHQEPNCTRAILWAVLCWAAARISSPAAAGVALCEVPSAQAVRDALLAILPEIPCHHELLLFHRPGRTGIY